MVNLGKTELKLNRIVDSVFHNPEIVGLDGSQIIHRQKEQELWIGNKLHVTPDLYFAEARGINNYFEVKSILSKNCKRKAKNQLERILEYLELNGLIESSMLGLIFPKNLRLGRYEVMKFSAEKLKKYGVEIIF